MADIGWFEDSTNGDWDLRARHSNLGYGQLIAFVRPRKGKYLVYTDTNAGNQPECDTLEEAKAVCIALVTLEES